MATCSQSETWVQLRSARFGNSPQKLEADQFPLHAHVPIYYDPEAPNECVIKRGVSLANVMLLGAGLFFLLIGVSSHRKLSKLKGTSKTIAA